MAAGGLARRGTVAGAGASRSVGPVPEYLQPLPAAGPPLLTSLSDPSPLTGGDGQEREEASGQAGVSGTRPRQDPLAHLRRYAVRGPPGIEQQQQEQREQQQQHQQQHEQEYMHFFAEP